MNLRRVVILALPFVGCVALGLVAACSSESSGGTSGSSDGGGGGDSTTSSGDSGGASPDSSSTSDGGGGGTDGGLGDPCDAGDQCQSGVCFVGGGGGGGGSGGGGKSYCSLYCDAGNGATVCPSPPFTGCNPRGFCRIP